MSDFEKLLSDNIDRDPALTANAVDILIREYQLSPTEAVQFEDVMLNAVVACLKVVGRSIDALPEGKPRCAGLMLLAGRVAHNMAAMNILITEVAIRTVVDYDNFVPNPSSPDCDCVNCNLSRAASLEMRKADER